MHNQKGGDAISQRTFIAEHQRDRHQPEFTALLPLHARVELLQPVDEQQCQQNHVLGDLCGREDLSHPFLKSNGRDRLGDEGRHWVLSVFDGLQLRCLLEPEKAGHLWNTKVVSLLRGANRDYVNAHLSCELGQTALAVVDGRWNPELRSSSRLLLGLFSGGGGCFFRGSRGRVGVRLHGHQRRGHRIELGPVMAVDVRRHPVGLPGMVDGRDGIVGDPSHVAGRSGQTVPEGSSPTGSSLGDRFR